MKEFHRRDFANRTGLAQAWTVKSADRLFTGNHCDSRVPKLFFTMVPYSKETAMSVPQICSYKMSLDNFGLRNRNKKICNGMST